METKMLPVPELLSSGVILKDPGISQEIPDTLGIPVVTLSPAAVAADPLGAFLAILRSRLGIPESADVLLEFFRDAQGKTHVLVFA